MALIRKDEVIDPKLLEKVLESLDRTGIAPLGTIPLFLAEFRRLQASEREAKKNLATLEDAETRRLREVERAAREAMKHLSAFHKVGCAKYSGPIGSLPLPPCDCGMDDLRAALEPNAS